MSELSNRTFTADDQLKIKTLINEGVRVKLQVKDQNEGLRDTVKGVAEALDIKPKYLNQAINTAFKENLTDAKEELDDVEELLHIAGINA